MDGSSLIPSPVTGLSTRRSDYVLVDQIVANYKRENGMDVSKFFDGLERLEILECESTTYRFFYPPCVQQEAFYDALEARYVVLAQEKNEDKRKFYRPWGHDYQFAYDRIHIGERVLDIGCGDGNFLRRIREKTTAACGVEFEFCGS